ncbi:MAG TPA: glycosyltransferase family 4 protein [Thermoanaerobaculia bacterium]
MHVAVICRALGGSGSVAAVALRQARELARHFRVTLISESFPDETPWASARLLVTLRDLNVLRRFRHVPDDYMFARASGRALLELQARDPLDFMLAHAHSVAWFGMQPLASRHRVPYGFFVHGDIFERPRGTYDARLTAFYRWVTPRAYRAAPVVFSLSETMGRGIRTRGAPRIEVVPNGIDPSDIGLGPPVQPSPRSPGEPLRILNVGRLSLEKGIDHLLDACALLSVDYRLDIAGGGPLEHQLRGRIDSLGLKPAVRLLGLVERSRMGALYSSYDVFCTPALNEPFALVILEALASGLPVIGTRVDGIPEVVKHEENGLLVGPADPSALAEAITRLAEDETLRLQLASRSVASVLPRYEWRAIGDQIADVIRRMA